MTQTINIDDIAKIIKEVAKEEILPRFRNLKESDIEQKTSPTDLVTIADKMSEKALKARLTDYLKGSLVVGEEETFIDPNVYERLKEPNYVWIIDPVDGTNSFKEGKETFGVIVSLVKNMETLAGFIYAPASDEMVVGELHSGAYKNGQRLHVKDADKISSLLAITGGKYENLRKEIGSAYWTRSAAIAYQHLAEGKANLGVFSTKPIKPWDHAAGVMLHREAGGYSSLINGEQYKPYPVEGVLFVAPNKDRWMELRQFI
ncbi:MAG: Inositol-1-monophosphatase [Alphaproteobacteria bacterium ADurb.Bin438]|nr:MAG: Inositol-1-monophosphatase [Alphaproteobacteria bacterium ADurb.Bin438]